MRSAWVKLGEFGSSGFLGGAKTSKQFLRYGLVGAGNTVLHWGVAAGLVEYGATFGLANVLGFVCSNLLSFWLNSRWTFRSEPRLRRFLVFFAGVSVLMFAIGVAGEILIAPLLLVVLASSLLSLGFGFLFARKVLGGTSNVD